MSAPAGGGPGRGASEHAGRLRYADLREVGRLVELRLDDAELSDRVVRLLYELERRRDAMDGDGPPARDSSTYVERGGGGELTP